MSDCMNCGGSNNDPDGCWCEQIDRLKAEVESLKSDAELYGQARAALDEARAESAALREQLTDARDVVRKIRDELLPTGGRAACLALCNEALLRWQGRALLATPEPKLTPETVRECLDRSGKDSAELDAHLRQTFTAPDNDTVLDSCGYPHKADPAPVERVAGCRCWAQKRALDRCPVCHTTGEGQTVESIADRTKGGSNGKG